MWWGGGLRGVGIDAGEPVIEEQMRKLFGHGLHPNAGPSPDAGSGALGRRFLVFVGAPEMAQRVAIGFGEFNQANGLSWRTPVPLQVRARIRGEVATEAYVERYRPSADRRARPGGVPGPQVASAHHRGRGATT